MTEDREMKQPRRQLTLGGQVLYDPEVPISDEERGRRIKRALRNLRWNLLSGDLPKTYSW